MTEDDLTKITDKRLLRSGGIKVTSKGYKRGPTLFLYCLAAARVRVILQKKQNVVLSAFCKCGFYGIKEAHKIFGIKEEQVTSAADELDDIQDELDDIQAAPPALETTQNMQD